MNKEKRLEEMDSELDVIFDELKETFKKLVFKSMIYRDLHLDNVKEDIIEVKEEVICCEKDHPKVYINLPIGKIMRCPYCNQAYKRIE